MYTGQVKDEDTEKRADSIESMRGEVLRGLRGEHKTLPCKLLYDRRGSKLFDRICELDAYYPTRTELAIMRRYAGDIAAVIGPRCLLIEYGSGSSLKTQVLLDHLESPAAYVPMDISREHLHEAAGRIRNRYPQLEVLPVCADFTRDFDIPPCRGQVDQRVVYFPGSTIGNFTPAEVAELLERIAHQVEGGGLLIGVDLKKDPAILERAYNDEEGVTAAFNLNVLSHINDALDVDIDVSSFEHKAIYNPDRGRVELYLVSHSDQVVDFGDEEIAFNSGDSIHTEYSHKFSLEGFERIAGEAGLRVESVWMDDDRLFSVQFLTSVR